MAEAYTLQIASQRLDSLLSQQSIRLNNARTYAIMSDGARSRGDHALAKRHLRKALDLEFEVFADCPVYGPLAEAWYPGEEL